MFDLLGHFCSLFDEIWKITCLLWCSVRFLFSFCFDDCFHFWLSWATKILDAEESYKILIFTEKYLLHLALPWKIWLLLIRNTERFWNSKQKHQNKENSEAERNFAKTKERRSMEYSRNVLLFDERKCWSSIHFTTKCSQL